MSEQGHDAAAELSEELKDHENVKAVYYADDCLMVTLVKANGSTDGIFSSYRSYPIILEDVCGEGVNRYLDIRPGERTFEEEIVENCDRHIAVAGLPERFTVRCNKISNGVIITDTVTGKEMEVGLCEVGGAYQAIRLFCT